MAKLNDHYFIAWLKVVKNYDFQITENKQVVVDMTKEEYSKSRKEYEETMKPLLKEVRKIVKVLALNTSKPN